MVAREENVALHIEKDSSIDKDSSSPLGQFAIPSQFLKSGMQNVEELSWHLKWSA